MHRNVKPLVKEQKSNGLPQSKDKSLSRQTKQETTDNLNELIDTELFQHWVDNQDIPTQESFLAFCQETYSIVECFLYARFLGYKGSISTCDHWVNKKYPKPDHRKVLLQEIEEMQEDIRHLRQDIENLAVKRDVGVARIAGMEKELRSTISQVEQFTNVKDRRGLMMAGADQAFRELMSIFKDDPIAGPLHDASLSVWAKIQTSE